MYFETLNIQQFINKYISVRRIRIGPDAWSDNYLRTPCTYVLHCYKNEAHSNHHLAFTGKGKLSLFLCVEYMCSSSHNLSISLSFPHTQIMVNKSRHLLAFFFRFLLLMIFDKSLQRKNEWTYGVKKCYTSLI